MFYLLGIFRISSLGDSISSNLERTVPSRQGKESGYIEVCNKHQGLLWIKKKQVSQIKEYSTLLCMGRCKCLGTLKSLPSYASQLSGASTLLLVSHGLSPACTLTTVSAVAGAGPQALLSVSAHLGLRHSHLEPQIADGCDILVYWYGRKYSISHLESISNSKKEGKVYCSLIIGTHNC